MNMKLLFFSLTVAVGFGLPLQSLVVVEMFSVYNCKVVNVSTQSVTRSGYLSHK